MNSKKLNEKEIDAMIGSKIRFWRKARGVSQSLLANHIGVVFQQIQKYEKGVNRISVSRLIEISKFLDVSLEMFFVEMDEWDRKSDEDFVKFISGYSKCPPKAQTLIGKIAHVVAEEF